MAAERARRAVAAAAVALAALSLSSPATAQGVDRQVILVVTHGMTYEAALRDPILGELAGHGGIGLMTTAGDGQTPLQAAISLGAGRSADAAPTDPLEYEEVGPGLAIDADPYRRV